MRDIGRFKRRPNLSCRGALHQFAHGDGKTGLDEEFLHDKSRAVRHVRTAERRKGSRERAEERRLPHAVGTLEAREHPVLDGEIHGKEDVRASDGKVFCPDHLAASWKCARFSRMMSRYVA